MNEKLKPLNEEDLGKIAGGAYNPDDLAPIQCPRCRDVATFTHVTYAAFTACADEYHCADPGCGCYIYKDRNTGAIQVFDKRFGQQ